MKRPAVKTVPGGRMQLGGRKVGEGERLHFGF